MLVLRLSRTGKTRQPSFRVIVQEKTSSPKKDFLEVLGNYSPARPSKPFEIKEERIKHWISKGAMPSDTVATLLKKKGFQGMEKFMTPRNKQQKRKGTEAKSKTAAAAPAEPAKS